MKYHHFPLTLFIALLLPLAAAASSDDEVTIRVMGMHETSSDSVMQMIELPIMQRQHQRQQDGRSAAGSSHADGAGDVLPETQQPVRESGAEVDHEPPLEALQEMQQEQLQDTEPALEQESQVEQMQEMNQQQQELESEHQEQTPGPEPSQGNQNGPGRGG